MSELDWDSKTVIGFKAKAPKVTRNASDLNGACFFLSISLYKETRKLISLLLQLYVY